MPVELLEHDIAERFGWTLGELDEQDMSRVLPAIQAANARDRLGRILSFLHSGGRMKPTDDDLKAYGEIIKAMKDG